MKKLEYIQTHISLPEKGISNTLELLEADASIPFIARYRKERTGDLDEVQVTQILKYAQQFDELNKRRESILKSIAEQGALTSQLEVRIQTAKTLIELEDLYLPYKKKRKSRADMARERGLQPLAKILMAQQVDDPLNHANRFVTKEVVNSQEALSGAMDIVSEWINQREQVRVQLRKIFQRAMISSEVIKKMETQEAAQKYQQYFDWEEAVRRIPSHRFLALQRGEKEGYLRLKINVQKEEALYQIQRLVLRDDTNGCAAYIHQAIEGSFKRLLLPAMSNEILAETRIRADKEAINVFASNLRQLLLAPPLGEKRILALDPGFKSGCKLVCLDEKGELLHNETIFPHPPQREAGMAQKKIKSLVNAHGIQAIAIGNGTASRQTEHLVKKVPFDREVQVFVVNEAGASVYSASKVAREEFPNYDVTVRGAVSIGRRLADPLAELVKIDPKAIGVGQYQHDVNQVDLKTELDRVVASCVNGIGVNVNTASAPLLAYVSGIGSGLAQNIVEYRRNKGGIQRRSELLKIPRLGAKAFEQAAGFLRISHPENPLDNSSVHPESYRVVEQMARDLKVGLKDLIGNKAMLNKINLQKYVSDKVGLPTLTDIISELEKPGIDPRKAAKVFEFDPSIKAIDDLKQGMSLPGIVNNITNFGCFVDIGIKQSGLVHISKLAKGYVSDVNAIVKLYQHVQVKVLEVDLDRKRIQLSMVD